MTFLARTGCIKEGDTVICYVTIQDMKAVIVSKNSEYRNKYGVFPHSQMIGKKWGSKMPNKLNSGFIHLLYPTPELWTLVLPHRTQILYQPDISLITTFLELKPNINMIEAGTGSGSFSHSIARTIAPHGRLYSFDYHSERVEKAKQEFLDHGLSEIITNSQRDVCKSGFGLVDQVQAIFLDLPSPWDALKSCKEAFKKDRIGRICCFSPCIEQVQRTCLHLKENGFVGIYLITF
jgi:tRNA (adenine57-N1/adenine58-N1)-methyltransferase